MEETNIDKKTMHITISKKALNELNDIKEYTNSENTADVIRESLALLKYLIEQEQKGYEIIVMKKRFFGSDHIINIKINQSN